MFQDTERKKTLEQIPQGKVLSRVADEYPGFGFMFKTGISIVCTDGPILVLLGFLL